MFVCVENPAHYFKWRVKRCCYCHAPVEFKPGWKP